jgi:hypothetical protein
MAKLYKVEKRKFDWHDDIDINFSDATIESYRKYFSVEVD